MSATVLNQPRLTFTPDHLDGAGQRMTPIVQQYVREVETAFQKQSAALTFKRNDMAQRHRDERAKLAKVQQDRQDKETLKRSERLRHGFRGLWDRLTGRHSKTVRQNEYEAYQSTKRDQVERETVIVEQLTERQGLQKDILCVRRKHAKELTRLHRDVAHYMAMVRDNPERLREEFERANPQQNRKDLGPSFEPDM